MHENGTDGKQYGILMIVVVIMVAVFVGTMHAPVQAKTENHQVDCIRGYKKKGGSVKVTGKKIGKVYATAKFISGIKNTKELAGLCNDKYTTECEGECIACSNYLWGKAGCYDIQGKDLGVYND